MKKTRRTYTVGVFCLQHWQQRYTGLRAIGNASVHSALVKSIFIDRLLVTGVRCHNANAHDVVTHRPLL